MNFIFILFAVIMCSCSSISRGPSSTGQVSVANSPDQILLDESHLAQMDISFVPLEDISIPLGDKKTVGFIFQNGVMKPCTNIRYCMSDSKLGPSCTLMLGSLRDRKNGHPLILHKMTRFEFESEESRFEQNYGIIENSKYIFRMKNVNREKHSPLLYCGVGDENRRLTVEEFRKIFGSTALLSMNLKGSQSEGTDSKVDSSNIQ